jgi:serine/threonine protein kinase
LHICRNTCLTKAKANILITPSHRACLADFGLAVPEDSASSRGSMSSGISAVKTTTIGGTWRWQAPELLSLELDDVNRKHTLASDVYAYGNVCYEVLYTYSRCQCLRSQYDRYFLAVCLFAKSPLIMRFRLRSGREIGQLVGLTI